MLTLEHYRRQAKALKKAYLAQEAAAQDRVHAALGHSKNPLKHAGALHVIALEAGHASWPKLKFALEAARMDRTSKARRLEIALYHGQHWVVDALLAETPDLGRDNFGLACALYDIEHVRNALAKDPDAATCVIGTRRPICHLGFSKHIHGAGSQSDMLDTAEVLLAHGGDVNDFYNYDQDPASPLSVLYGAVGHANNMVLARWLLDNGANPNDGESLYHATELGHTEGLKLLLAHGAKPKGTNALLRALDFDDTEAVGLLLAAGAHPNDRVQEHPSGEPAIVIPALHQAARRMCGPATFQLLLDNGADPSMRHLGITPYALARVYGNLAAADLIASAGGTVDLTEDEALLQTAAEGPVPEGRFLNPAKLPEEYRNLLHEILPLPGKRDHVERLVAIGAEWDKPDQMGLTPVQVAGWSGLAEMMDLFLRLKPDLSHTNAYGGTLLSTIIHGSENCPARDDRDHIACARRALEEGVALPRNVMTFAGDAEMAEFLSDWAEAHPGQVIEA